MISESVGLKKKAILGRIGFQRECQVWGFIEPVQPRVTCLYIHAAQMYIARQGDINKYAPEGCISYAAYVLIINSSRCLRIIDPRARVQCRGLF